MHAPVISEKLATDADSAELLLTEAYGEGRVRVRDGSDFRFGQRRQDMGELRIDEVAYSFFTEYDMNPLDYLLILRVGDGELAFEDVRGTRRLFRTGDVFLCAPPGEGYRAITRARSAQAIGIDLSLLGRVGDEPSTDVVRRFTRDALAPEQARHWRRTVDYVTDTLTANDTAASSDLVLGAAGRMLAAAAVTAFTADLEARRDEGSGTMAATVRRAIAYMEANPDLDLGVAEIAEAAHVSVRALQVAFRRQLDTTPMSYLRRIRLDRARVDLRDADPFAGATVTAIAARWGFADASRFSAYYRHAFGEPPRDTLRN